MGRLRFVSTRMGKRGGGPSPEAQGEVLHWVLVVDMLAN